MISHTQDSSSWRDVTYTDCSSKTCSSTDCSSKDCSSKQERFSVGCSACPSLSPVFGDALHLRLPFVELAGGLEGDWEGLVVLTGLLSDG